MVGDISIHVSILPIFRYIDTVSNRKVICNINDTILTHLFIEVNIIIITIINSFGTDTIIIINKNFKDNACARVRL